MRATQRRWIRRTLTAALAALACTGSTEPRTEYFWLSIITKFRSYAVAGESLAVEIYAEGGEGFRDLTPVFSLAGVPGARLTTGACVTQPLTGSVYRWRKTCDGTIDVGLTVPPARYAARLIGQAAGYHTMDYAFFLQVVVPTGTIGLTLAPATLSMPAGTSRAVTVDIVRSTPEVGAVRFGTPSLPPGVTLTPLYVGSFAERVTLTVTVARNATPGRYAITLTAVGEQTAVHQATLELEVLPAPP